MSRQDINRSAEMAVFVEVVEWSGFSAAARRLDMTPSAVSKLIGRLETRLGARLLNRTTRQLQTTPEGAAFYAQCKRILEDIDCAEREASQGAAPRGSLRVNCFSPFGILYFLPILPEFMQRYPDITVDVAVNDIVIDLLADRADLAIRTGKLKESNLIARKLGAGPMVVVAAPAYLARHGVPATPAELASHNLLEFSFTRHMEAWPFLDGGHQVMVQPQGNAMLSDGESMRHAVLAGLGLARLSRMHVQHDIDAGRLVALLEPYNPGDIEEVHAVFVGPGTQLPARVRVMLDFLLEKIRFPGAQH
ncbi:LysR family transcriptional regulator [Janthinobacterium agaricidamnosum]|uniref:Bacterial regulatory helix-turn-helix, lysR family protein n=1 Tax=Janthinobacterium agaricidamnosum NBRC 102515 = DSM 9628 TaxID=1349767 RepID=W0V8N4_9BURK|nr:LysR family transcriptional regulator [Janthinobacterium agaricidamnosum]CDG83930.1 bacterial regulatory helix-turn-helix, lysR family protein [Janthinobacterium agaricidamnosum NBRC 102515 = DSM 9628]